MTAQEIADALVDYFPASAIGWKPQVVSKDGTKALAVAFIDARDVMRRLDAVCGINGWKDEYEFLPSGCVVCKLSVRIDGEWISKMDVGGMSQQPDDGDKHKAAVSDALKRCAIKWGIGRYLYDLPMNWYPIDQYKKFTQTPRLPDWALPKMKGAPATSATPTSTPSTNGSSEPHSTLDFIKRLEAFDERLSSAVPPLCKKGDCVAHVKAAASFDGWPAKVEDWTPLMLKTAMDEAIKFKNAQSKAIASAHAVQAEQPQEPSY